MVETFINFVTTYSDVLVAVLGSLALVLTAFAFYFHYFVQDAPETRAENDLQGIEESLKKLILEMNQGGLQGTRVGAVAAEHMGIPIPGTGKYGKIDPDTGNLLDEEGNLVLDEDGNPIPASTLEGADAAKAAAAEMAAGASGATPANADPAQIVALKKELDTKKSELSQLKEKLEGGDLNNTDELLAKLKVLQDRLAEYEIIEDDIADLSIYKEENIRLKEELEAFKSGGAPPAAKKENDESTQEEAAPAPAPEPSDDELHAEFDEAARKLEQEADLSTEGVEGEQTADLSTEGGEGEQTADLSTEGVEGEQIADLSTEGGAAEREVDLDPEEKPVEKEIDLSTEGEAPVEKEVVDEPAEEAPPAPETKVDDTPEKDEGLGSVQIKDSEKAPEKASDDIFAEFSGGDDGGDPLGEFDPDKMLKELHGIDTTGADASVVQDDTDIDKMANEAKKL